MGHSTNQTSSSRKVPALGTLGPHYTPNLLLYRRLTRGCHAHDLSQRTPFCCVPLSWLSPSSWNPAVAPSQPWCCEGTKAGTSLRPVYNCYLQQNVALSPGCNTHMCVSKSLCCWHPRRCWALAVYQLAHCLHNLMGGIHKCCASIVQVKEK